LRTATSWATRWRARSTSARADLERQLRRIIGPSEIKGFAKEGELNLDSLSSGFMGFGLLDALAYVSPDEKSRVLVTTDELSGKWLRARKPDVPQMPTRQPGPPLSTRAPCRPTR